MVLIQYRFRTWFCWNGESSRSLILENTKQEETSFHEFYIIEDSIKYEFRPIILGNCLYYSFIILENIGNNL